LTLAYAGVAHDRRIEFRIGIHVGDVVEESDGDMMGDSVNIAARLEGIAKPGAICLSEQAYWQVKARLDIAVSDLGATQLKNIAEPVRAFSLQVGLPAEAKPAAPVEPSAAERPAKRPSLSDKPSIAVLPFQNMSGDAEQDYCNPQECAEIRGFWVVTPFVYPNSRRRWYATRGG
jgi:adenylate cyclase